MKIAFIVTALCVLLCAPLLAQEKESLPAWETYKDKASGSIYSGLSAPTGTIDDARTAGKAVTVRGSKAKAELLAGKEQLEKAVALFPLAELYFHLGNVHYFLGDYEKALLCFQIAAFRDYEEVWWAYYNGACSASLLGRVDLALEYLQKAADWGLPDFKAMKTDPDLAACRKSQKFAALMKKIEDKNYVPEIFKLEDSLYTESGMDDPLYFAGFGQPGPVTGYYGMIQIKNNTMTIHVDPEKAIAAFEARGAQVSDRDRERIISKETVLCTVTRDGTAKGEFVKKEKLEVTKKLIGRWEYAQGFYRLSITTLLRCVPKKVQAEGQMYEGGPAPDYVTTKLDTPITVRLKAERPRLLPTYEERLKLGWPSRWRMISLNFFPELFKGSALWGKLDRYELEHMP